MNQNVVYNKTESRDTPLPSGRPDTILSVIVTTKDRPEKLHRCLASILRNTFRRFELIVVDQRENNENKRVVERLASKRIRYCHIDRSVQMVAINTGIRMAKGAICVMTDDDCVVPRNWLSTIHRTYAALPNISGLSGQILPYKPAKPGKEYISAGLYESKRSHFVTRVGPTVHHPEVGFGKGANMSFRREVFDTVGGFREWLGPGALGAAGESEFIYRVIRNRFVLYVLPALVVYHDRWLTHEESLLLLSHKIPGYTAFISYHIIKDFDLSLFDGLFRFRWLCIPAVRAGVRLLLFGVSQLTPQERYVLRMSYGWTKGIVYGSYYAVRDSVTRTGT